MDYSCEVPHDVIRPVEYPTPLTNIVQLSNERFEFRSINHIVNILFEEGLNQQRKSCEEQVVETNVKVIIELLSRESIHVGKYELRNSEH